MTDNEDNVFLQLFEKSQKRLNGIKRIEAKDLALGYIYPLLAEMYRSLQEMGQNTDENFEDVYKALNLSSDYFVLKNASNLITKLGAFIDSVMISAGYLEKTDQGLVITTKMPPAIMEQFTALPEELVNTLTAIQEAMEADGSEDEDGGSEDEFDDDEDDDGDDEGDDEDSNEEVDASFEGEIEEDTLENETSPSKEKEAVITDAEIVIPDAQEVG